MLQNPATRLACALWLILFSIYVLTASGHTYSPDEESIVYVAQSFLSHGDFNIPNPERFPVVAGLIGLNGERYSGTGLLTSLTAAPLLAVANALTNSLDPQWHNFTQRLVLGNVFNAMLSAAGAVVLYGWWRRLRVPPRVAFALALVYGLATLTWEYARTLYSESYFALLTLIACYAVCNYGSSHRRGWLFAAGLAAGLAVLTKVQGVLIVPPVAAYAVLTAWQRDGQWSTSVRRAFLPALVFCLGLAVGFAISAYYNILRFGTPLEFGYGNVPADYPILQGLYGLLLSPGKSVFLYAPPVLLGLGALPQFARRFRAEAIACILLILTILLFHARVWYWHGDGAWGPRYLAMTMAFWLLPLGTVIPTWWKNRLARVLLLAPIAAGLVVNLLAIAVNFDTYIQIEPRSQVRYYDPGGSPIIAHWNLASARVTAWFERFVPNAPGVFLFTGWLNPNAPDEPFPRFMTRTATLSVQNPDQVPLRLSLVALDYRPEDQPRRTLEFFVDGVALPAERVPHGDVAELEYHVRLAPARTILVTLATVGTRSHGRSPQGDELGLHVQLLQVDTDTTTFPLYIEPWVPPLSTADPKEQAAWFYAPAFAQFDWFGWYAAFSGLPANVVSSLIGGFLAFGLAALGTGIVLVPRARQQ